MINQPVLMEVYFNPGFKTKPAVHVGSQTLKFFHGNLKEQAWEGFSLAGAFDGDVIVLRDLDPNYATYWNNFAEDLHIINLLGVNKSKFLTEIILKDSYVVNLIKQKMQQGSKLMVSHPTKLEEKLANILGIPLHGSPQISDLYGTKSGIRNLAKEFGLLMPPGFVCFTYSQIEKARSILQDSFDEVVIKHDLSLSGYFSEKIKANDIDHLKTCLDKVAGGKFNEEKDVVVVEGWLKSKASLCAHIEISEGKEPIICAGWQQIIDKDGKSYIGASPLMISPEALKSFIAQVNKLARALKEKGGVGSYGSDFLVTSDLEKNIKPDTCVLVELNARAPYTAFSLETVKQIKGKIGHGFRTQRVKLPKPISFSDIKGILERESLLITKRDSNSKGVVPYNVGLLPWRLFDIVAIGDSWEEALWMIKKVNSIFNS